MSDENTVTPPSGASTPTAATTTTTDATTTPTGTTTRGGVSWSSLVLAVLFGLVYAYFVWGAIGNLIQLPRYYELIGLSDSVPWALLVIGLLVPIVGYVVAFIVSLRSSVLHKVVIYVMGIAAVAALGYTIVAINSALSATL